MKCCNEKLREWYVGFPPEECSICAKKYILETDDEGIWRQKEV